MNLVIYVVKLRERDNLSIKFKVGDRVKAVGFQYGVGNDGHGTVISVSKSGYTGEDVYEVRWDGGNISKYIDIQIEKLTKCERIMEALGIEVGEFFSLVDPDTGETYCSPYSMMANGEILDENGEKLSCDEYAAILKGYAIPTDKAKEAQEINDKIADMVREIDSLKKRRKELLA